MGLPVVSAAVLERGTKRALIDSARDAQRSYVGVFARRINSDGAVERLPWLSQAPIMKRLRDMLESAGLSDAVLEIENEKFAISLEVPRDLLSDDQLGAVMQRVREMTDIAMGFGNVLLIDALEAGIAEGGYDGQPFYDNAHPVRGLQSAVFDNLLAGTGTTVAAIQADLSTYLSTLQRAEGENGQPLYQARTRHAIVHPPELTANMNVAIFGQMVPEIVEDGGGPVAAASISNNKFRGLMFDPVSDARLADSDDWYGADVTTEMRMPLFYVERERVQSEVLGPGSDHYVKHESALFKVRWRGKAAYGQHGNTAKIVN